MGNVLRIFRSVAAVAVAVCVVATAHAAAGLDTTAMKRVVTRSATEMMYAMKSQDYAVFLRYQHPLVIKELGGQDSAMAFFKKQLTKLSTTKITTLKAGKVLQVLKYPGGYQCVVEQLMEVMVDSARISSVLPLVGFSTDGTTWTFADGSKGAAAIRSVIPTLAGELRIPAKHTEFGKGIEATYRAYTPMYVGTVAAKNTKRKKKRK
ncbi:MAG: hypothetical protein JNL32_04295 [Candidatus Kapabacteria bacterium]|nr:hypothetical protein [Candidatus Kapabacteria bacterium]